MQTDTRGLHHSYAYRVSLGTARLRLQSQSPLPLCQNFPTQSTTRWIREARGKHPNTCSLKDKELSTIVLSEPRSMSLAQASSGATPVADPQRSLNDALASFRSVLSVDQQEALKNSPAETDVDKVMVFTAELDQKAKGMRGPSVATRLHAVLEAVHLFSTVVDTFVSSNPEIAALVWGSIKMTMLASSNLTTWQTFVLADTFFRRS